MIETGPERSGTEGESEERKISTEHIPQTTLIDMVNIAEGCREACAACGAFGEGEKVKTREVDPEDFSKTLQQILAGTRLRLIDIFRRYVTTGIKAEPLNTGNFSQCAREIYEQSEGHSRLVAISHGLHLKKRQTTNEDGNREYVYEKDERQVETLEEIVSLMLKDIVPLFVLSFDAQRKNARMGVDRESLKILGLMEKDIEIFRTELSEAESDLKKLADAKTELGEFDEENMDESERDRREKIKRQILINNNILERNKAIAANNIRLWEQEMGGLRRELDNQVIEANAQSYAKTITHLWPAIESGKRVTISFQGVPYKGSPVYVGKTMLIYNRMKEILEERFGRDLTYDLNILSRYQDPRHYARLGRGRRSSLHIDYDKSCPVIPDEGFLQTKYREDPCPTNRGVVDMDGNLWIQRYQCGNTYNDTADPSKNPFYKVDLNDPGFFTAPEETAEEVSFMEFLRKTAVRRVVEMPPEGYESSDSIEDDYDIFEVYPLSLLDEADRDELLEYIRKHWRRDKRIGEEGIKGLGLKYENVREFVIRSLLDLKYIYSERNEESGETFNRAEERMIEDIVEYFSPDLRAPSSSTYSIEDISEKDRKKMGEVLALKKLLLGELCIYIQLNDDRPEDVEKEVYGYQSFDMDSFEGEEEVEGESDREVNEEDEGQKEGENDVNSRVESDRVSMRYDITQDKYTSGEYVKNQRGGDELFARIEAVVRRINDRVGDGDSFLDEESSNQGAA
ncbi:hypothetical protein GF366_00565 [Candidatus Peregrinibacteria bacterium]|nr:hypothetical protein [Candidatus Peregrinibacteria bacterium]